MQVPEVTIRYQYDNHLGSASLELDETAQLITYEEYHPFGTTSYRAGRSLTETSLKRYKYVGKERDEETGLYYYGARFYADWLCRFVSVDPLQFKYPELTPFQYASNSPVSFIDMDGLERTDANSMPEADRFRRSFNSNPSGKSSQLKLEDLNDSPYSNPFQYVPPAPGTFNTKPGPAPEKTPAPQYKDYSAHEADATYVAKKQPYIPVPQKSTPVSTQTPSISRYNSGGMSEDVKENIRTELNEQQNFDKKLYEYQELSPVMFGQPGQPHGAGLYSSLEYGLKVEGAIEGGYGAINLIKGGINLTKGFNLTKINFAKPSVSGNFAAEGGTSLEKASGSYLLEFQSGKFYAGKGLESRMMQSINRIETTGDLLKPGGAKFFPASSSREAFINEYNMMKNIGLPTKYDHNSLLYNKIWSPGKKLLGQ